MFKYNRTSADTVDEIRLSRETAYQETDCRASDVREAWFEEFLAG